MSLWYYHPKMILRSDALPAFEVAATRGNAFIPATQGLVARTITATQDAHYFDERGAATFAHLASEQTIAQLFRQVYYVNKYATNFLREGSWRMRGIGRGPASTHKRTEHASKREHFSRVDCLVYYSGYQLLQEAAAANPARDKVVQPWPRKPVLRYSVTEKLRLQFALDAVRKLSEPA